MIYRMAMIQDADNILRDIVRSERAKEDDQPDAPDMDFGLYHPLDYVIATWNEHRQHGNFPEAGGYNDQDPLLIEHDWRIIGERFAHLMQSYEKDWK